MYIRSCLSGIPTPGVPHVHVSTYSLESPGSPLRSPRPVLHLLRIPDLARAERDAAKESGEKRPGKAKGERGERDKAILVPVLLWSCFSGDGGGATKMTKGKEGLRIGCEQPS